MSRLRSVKRGPQEDSRIYRESLIDPQAPSTRNGMANASFPSYQYTASGSSGSHWHDSASNACGTIMHTAGNSHVSLQRQRLAAQASSSQEVHAHAQFGRHNRPPPTTLDEVDIEALISSYKPMLHPSVRESLEDQYSVIGASRRERETRLALGHSSAGHSSNPTNSANSTASGSIRSLQLPSATSNPLQSAIITRSSSAPTGRPISSNRNDSSSSRSRTNFLSGEIVAEDFEEQCHIRAPPPAMKRAASQSSQASSAGRQRVASGNGDMHRRPSLSAFLSGSIARSHTSDSSRPTPSSTPLSSPPVPSVPTRFTHSSPANTGPGSHYTSREVNPFFSGFSRKKSDNVNDSPRSSVSSKSNNPSLRWSSGSAKTSSTSRHTPQHTYNQDDVVIISSPAGGPTKSAVETRGINPAAFSWLSFEEEEEYRQVLPKSEAPVMERKNSLWRESLDSLASSRFEVDDNDDVLASHFPQPPVMSRSNSVATTTTPEASFHTPPEFEDGEASQKEISLKESASIADLTSRRFEESAAQAAPMARKVSITEMLRTHVVSPLSRNSSKSSSKSSFRDGGRNMGPVRSDSASSLSASSLGRSPMPAQAACHA
ncbi:hypothetical protein P389DRAFT_192150 [Cystobasidium minutum MCA 4210]|uniref:uncharacterized protein n=1 Tax=Cystobasidium minutum MCA 4210 TaxID=1397322 RepID=UPI0034CEE051|eukprot:jgi/Rhomi1/192150/gm1.364_g